MGERIKCSKANEKREIERRNRRINGSEPRWCSLKLKYIATNYQLLKAVRSKDSIRALEIYLGKKKKVNHMTFHRIFSIKKKREAVISLSCCHGYLKPMTLC